MDEVIALYGFWVRILVFVMPVELDKRPRNTNLCPEYLNPSKVCWNVIFGLLEVNTQ